MAHEERSAGFIAFSTPRSCLRRTPARAIWIHRTLPTCCSITAGTGTSPRATSSRARTTDRRRPRVAGGDRADRAQVVPGFRHEITYFFRHRKRGWCARPSYFFLARVPSDRGRPQPRTRRLRLPPLRTGSEACHFRHRPGSAYAAPTPTWSRLPPRRPSPRARHNVAQKCRPCSTRRPPPASVCRRLTSNSRVSCPASG